MIEAPWRHRPRPGATIPAESILSGAPSSLADVRALRRRLRTVLSEEGRPPGVTDDDVDRLLLAFEELASNGLRHGGAPVRLAVTAVGGGWLVEVSDASGDVPPVPAVGRDAALGGLGLYLVAQLSGAHGWTAEDDGRKVVWARVDVTGEAPPAPTPAAPLQAPAQDRTPVVVRSGPAPARAPGERPSAGSGQARSGQARSGQASSGQASSGQASSGQASSGQEGPGRAGRFRATPRRLGVLVAAVVLVITLALAWVASAVNANNNEKLLSQQVAQGATLLATQVAVIQTQMADTGHVADATDGRPAPFANFAAATVLSPEMSLSLWRVTGERAERLALHGPDPHLPDGGADAFFAGPAPTGQLAVAGVLQGDRPRLAYALMPAVGTGGLVVYAEVPLNRRVSVEAGQAYGGLDLAVYLGDEPDDDQLIQATAPTPIDGDTATAQVPFGDSTFTVVAASPTGLTGPLSAALPWIVLGGGSLLALAGGATAGSLARRRAVAERLAADNAELYRQQRGIAGTLQHALLPEVPQLDGVEVAARYVAGVDELEVGGDWYDVIPGPSGRSVFVVGDVSGQGLAAATTMASLRFALRAYVAQGDDITTVLTRLRGLLDIGVDHQFATVLIGELDPAAGLVRVVTAGHFGPLVVSGGRAEFLDGPVAPPIGVSASAPPVVAEARVSGPTTLLAFTDGAVERRGEVIDTGLERLRSTAAAADAEPLSTVLDRLMHMPDAVGGRDDTVILGLRWRT
jgi:serine phosphatase RsbU (regulator of sigma subunit)/anti-sigma regulatory factor (Ser/Thr protein kinase)